MQNKREIKKQLGIEEIKLTCISLASVGVIVLLLTFYDLFHCVACSQISYEHGVFVSLVYSLMFSDGGHFLLMLAT